MAKYRPLYTKVWKDPDFQELSPVGKLVFIYLCTNEATSESGIYPLTYKTLADETGLDRTEAERLLNGNFYKNVEYDPVNQLVFVVKFKRYNTGGKPELVKRSILNDYHAYPQTSLWERFRTEYPELSNGLPTVSQRLANGSSGSSPEAAGPLNNPPNLKGKGKGNPNDGLANGLPTVPTQSQKTTTTTSELTAFENAVARPVTPFERDTLMEFAKTYTVAWTVDAIKEAAAQGKHKVNTAYMRSILERWTLEGRGDGRKPASEPAKHVRRAL